MDLKRHANTEHLPAQAKPCPALSPPAEASFSPASGAVCPRSGQISEHSKRAHRAGPGPAGHPGSGGDAGPALPCLCSSNTAPAGAGLTLSLGSQRGAGNALSAGPGVEGPRHSRSRCRAAGLQPGADRAALGTEEQIRTTLLPDDKLSTPGGLTQCLSYQNHWPMELHNVHCVRRTGNSPAPVRCQFSQAGCNIGVLSRPATARGVRAGSF